MKHCPVPVNVTFSANLDKPEPLRIWHSGKFTESARKGQVTKLQSTEGGSLFIHSLKKKTTMLFFGCLLHLHLACMKKIS